MNEREAPRDRQPSPRRPDASPMRLLYGAGAAAAVSALTVAIVQPAADAPENASVPMPDFTVAVVDGRRPVDPAAFAPAPQGIAAEPGVLRVVTRDRLEAAPQRRRARARTRQSGG